MKLLTKEILADFKKIGTQEEILDPIIVCKFFNPCGIGTWYACEFDEESKNFFGYVILHEKEWGYFSLNELESVKLPFGLKIERDLHFTPCKFSELKD